MEVGSHPRTPSQFPSTIAEQPASSLPLQRKAAGRAGDLNIIMGRKVKTEPARDPTPQSTECPCQVQEWGGRKQETWSREESMKEGSREAGRS